MTAASASQERKEQLDTSIIAAQVLAAQNIYKGTPVFADASSGYAQTNDGSTITIAAGDVFMGLAYEDADNTSGASGAINVRCIQEGIFLLPISDGSLTVANVGDAVYVNNVSDNSTFTITTDTGNPQVTIGRIVKPETATTAWVKLVGQPVIAANA